MPKPTRFPIRSAALALLLLVHGATFAVPLDADDPAASATLPQSSAALVGELFARRGWSAGPEMVGAGSGVLERMRGKAADMISTAMNFVGVRYRRGGSSAEGGFDCSGFTRQVFESSVGILLPRRAEEQARAAGLQTINRDELRPGDLVFFNTLRRTFSHVGIYLGDDKFIHSPSIGGEVRVDDMRFIYWATRYTGARRAPIDILAQEGVLAYPIR